MKLITILIIATFSFAVSAEDLPIREKLIQPENAPLETYIGGQIFKLTRTSPLPNAFGKADIFGRKVDRGFIELRYQGQTPEGKIIFRLVDVDVRSNETTMNRNKFGVTTGLATTSGGSSITPAITRGTAITVIGQEGRNEMLPPNTTEFAIDIQNKKVLKFGTVNVNITDVDETVIKYLLQVTPD